MDTSSLVPLLPIDAAVAGKDDAARNAIFERFARLPEPVRFFMASLDTAKSISALVQRGILPQTHGIAAARLVAFVALGDVAPEQIPSLLEKIGIPDAASVFKELEAGPLRMLAEARKAPPPTLPKPTPPLAVRKPAASPTGRPPAIIDLRKQQP